MTYFGKAAKFVNRTQWMGRRRGKFAKRYPRINNLADSAAKIFGLQKQVDLMKGLINVEKKFIDVENTATLPTSSGVIEVLNDIPAGDDAEERNGNSILAKYITLNGRIVINPSATTTFVRILVVVDKHGQGTPPTLAQLLQDASINRNLTSRMNIDNVDRFYVLFNRLIPLNNNGNGTKVFKMYRKLNFHLKYDGTSTGSYDSNAIYCVMISDQLVTDPTPFINWHSRIAFYDN